MKRLIAIITLSAFAFLGACPNENKDHRVVPPGTRPPINRI